MAFISPSEYEGSFVVSFSVKNPIPGTNAFNLTWTKPKLDAEVNSYDIKAYVGDGTTGAVKHTQTVLGNATSVSFTFTESVIELGLYTFTITPKYKVTYPWSIDSEIVYGKALIAKVNSSSLTTNTDLNNPLSLSVDVNDGSIYVYNGYVTTQADWSTGRTVSKINKDNTVVNITTTNNVQASNDTGYNALPYYNDKVYTLKYLSAYNYRLYSLNVKTKAVVEEATNYFSSSWFNATFGNKVWADRTTGKLYTAGSYTPGGSTTFHGLWLLDDDSFTGTRTIPSDATHELLNTTLSSTNTPMYTFKITGIDTTGLKIGQVVEVNFASGNQGFYEGTWQPIITEITSNSFTYVIVRSTQFNSNVPTLPASNRYMVLRPEILIGGHLVSTYAVGTFPENNFYMNLLLKTISSGTTFNNKFYGGRYNGSSSRYEVISFDMVTKQTSVLATLPQYALIDDITTDSNGNIYVAGGKSINKITPTGTVTLLAGRNAAGSSYGDAPVDGAGTTARFTNINEIVFNPIDNLLYVTDNGSISQSVMSYNGIRTITLDGVVGPKIAEDSTDTSAGNADVNGGSDINLGNNGWSANIPPAPGEGTSGTIDVSTPEGTSIASVPITGGWTPDDVFTFRKDFDKLYLLLNGVIVWSYTLSSIQLMTFTSSGYVGWYTYGSKTPTTTPTENIDYPLYNARYYTFDTDIIQQGLGEHPLFARSINKASQALIVNYDENNQSFSVEERPYDLDIQEAAFVVLGGRDYSFTLLDINNNEITYTMNSPILPQYVVEMIANSPYHVYLREVGV